jgi:quercetin dioxygenase-like cupin family protein
MNEHVIDFRDIGWQVQRPGVRIKSRTKGDQTIRLVEFTGGVLEEDWCIKGHIGLVLDGEMEIDFGQSVSKLTKGDGLYIPEGTRHRATVSASGSAVLVFVEKA